MVGQVWDHIRYDRGQKFPWLEPCLTQLNGDNSHFFSNVISLHRTSCPDKSYIA